MFRVRSAVRRTAFLGALALLLGAAPAGARNQSTDTDFDWSWTLTRGQTLEVRGINGDLRVEAAAGREARVVAKKQDGKRCDAGDVRIEFVENEDGIVVCALYPRRDGENICGSDEDWSSDNCDTRVDWTIEVPAGVRFVGATVNGGVKASGLRGPAKLNTVNGSIGVETTSWASAHTVNGSITASLGVESWEQPLEFETVNGGIEIELPREVSAEVRGQLMNGSLHSDFPVMVRGRVGMRRVRGTIGDGGSPLEISTLNGDLTLRAR